MFADDQPELFFQVAFVICRVFLDQISSVWDIVDVQIPVGTDPHGFCRVVCPFDAARGAIYRGTGLFIRFPHKRQIRMVFPSAGFQTDLPERILGVLLTACHAALCLTENIFILQRLRQCEFSAIAIVYECLQAIDQVPVHFFRFAASIAAAHCIAAARNAELDIIGDLRPVLRLIRTGTAVLCHRVIVCFIFPYPGIRLDKSSVRSGFRHTITDRTVPFCPGRRHRAMVLRDRRFAGSHGMHILSGLGPCKVIRALPRLVGKGSCAAELVQRKMIDGFPWPVVDLPFQGIGRRQRRVSHAGIRIAVPARIEVLLLDRDLKRRKIQRLRLLVFRRRFRRFCRGKADIARDRICRAGRKRLQVSASAVFAFPYQQVIRLFLPQRKAALDRVDRLRVHSSRYLILKICLAVFLSGNQLYSRRRFSARKFYFQICQHACVYKDLLGSPDPVVTLLQRDLLRPALRSRTDPGWEIAVVLDQDRHVIVNVLGPFPIQRIEVVILADLAAVSRIPGTVGAFQSVGVFQTVLLFTEIFVAKPLL